MDLGALEPSTPLLTLPSSIGKGALFISRFISAKLDASSERMKPLLDYLLALDHGGQVRRAGYGFLREHVEDLWLLTFLPSICRS